MWRIRLLKVRKSLQLFRWADGAELKENKFYLLQSPKGKYEVPKILWRNSS